MSAPASSPASATAAIKRSARVRSATSASLAVADAAVGSTTRKRPRLQEQQPHALAHNGGASALSAARNSAQRASLLMLREVEHQTVMQYLDELSMCAYARTCSTLYKCAQHVLPHTYRGVKLLACIPEPIAGYIKSPIVRFYPSHAAVLDDDPAHRHRPIDSQLAALNVLLAHLPVRQLVIGMNYTLGWTEIPVQLCEALKAIGAADSSISTLEFRTRKVNSYPDAQPTVAQHQTAADRRKAIVQALPSITALHCNALTAGQQLELLSHIQRFDSPRISRVRISIEDHDDNPRYQREDGKVSSAVMRCVAGNARITHLCLDRASKRRYLFDVLQQDESFAARLVELQLPLFVSTHRNPPHICKLAALRRLVINMRALDHSTDMANAIDLLLTNAPALDTLVFRYTTAMVQDTALDARLAWMCKLMAHVCAQTAAGDIIVVLRPSSTHARIEQLLTTHLPTADRHRVRLCLNYMHEQDDADASCKRERYVGELYEDEQAAKQASKIARSRARA